jgi:hypothetical protein
MTDPRPAPFTNAKVDTDGAPAFMLDAQALLTSDLMMLSSPAEFKAAIRLWCWAWYNQEPAASLPDNDIELAAYANVPLAAWKKMRPMALRGFVECSDGRLYHPILSADANRLHEKRVANEKRTEAATRKRNEDRNKQRDVERDVDSRTPMSDENGQRNVVPVFRLPSSVEKETPTPPPSEAPTPPAEPPPEPPATTATIQPVGHRIAVKRIMVGGVELVRAALATGELAEVVKAFSARWQGREDEWKIAADGLMLTGIAGILAWRRNEGSPVREPSGFRKARAEFKALSSQDRNTISLWFKNWLNPPPPVAAQPIPV